MSYRDSAVFLILYLVYLFYIYVFYLFCLMGPRPIKGPKSNPISVAQDRSKQATKFDSFASPMVTSHMAQSTLQQPTPLAWIPCPAPAKGQQIGATSCSPFFMHTRPDQTQSASSIIACFMHKARASLFSPQVHHQVMPPAPILSAD